MASSSHAPPLPPPSQQQGENEHEHERGGDGCCVRLCCTKVPRQAVVANGCKVPLGAVISNLFQTTTTTQQTRGGSQIRSQCVILVDTTLETDQYSALTEGLVETLASIPQDTHVGLVGFSSAVEVFDIEEGDKSVTRSVVGTPNLTGAVDLREIIGTDNSTSSSNNSSSGRGRGSGSRVDCFVRKVEACRGDVCSVLRSIRPNHERPRSLVAAVDLARQLLVEAQVAHKVMGATGGKPTTSGLCLNRIMVLTGGNCTCGPGAMPLEDHPDYLRLEREAEEFIERLAQKLTKSSIIVDVFGAGHRPLDVPALYPLTQNTGGSLLMYEEFGQEYFSCLKASFTRFVGIHAVVDFRLSDELEVEQIIGPIKALSPNQHGGVFEPSDYSSLSENAVEMTSVEKGHGVAIAFRVKRDIPGAKVALQVDVKYIAMDGSRKHRVINASISVTDSGREFILSVDPLVTGVMLAKKSLVNIRKQGFTPKAVTKLRRELGNHVYDVSRKFSAKIASGGLFSKPTCVVKDELATFAEFVYHLTRTMVMSTNGHVDEKMIFVAQLLSSNITKSILMIWPRCLSLTPTGPVPLPSADMTLQMRDSFLLDCGTDCFVWTRKETAKGEGESCFRKYKDFIAHMLTKGRFPMPQIHLCREGSPNARYIQSRLMPLRQDAPEDIERQYPLLATVDMETRKKYMSDLISTYHCTDEPSFKEWCTGIHLDVKSSEGLGIPQL